jgi:hypothetical protein
MFGWLFWSPLRKKKGGKHVKAAVAVQGAAAYGVAKGVGKLMDGIAGKK